MRIGTRGSALALAQAGPVAERLGAELITIEPEGDRPLRAALLAGEVDAVVHSFPDLPIRPADGLVVAAVPKRADARDALVARDGLTLDDLPAGARVGTDSSRRRAQVLARRPDLDVVEDRGTLDTRLARVGVSTGSAGGVDAVVIAAAGLDRVGRLGAATELLGIDAWPTDPAQGCLAVEVRLGDEKKVVRLDHTPSHLAAEAERGVLRRLEAGCAAPVGAHALLEDGLLFLSARVYSLDGSAQLTGAHALYPADSPHPADELAERVADELFAAGAAGLAPLDGAS